MPAFTPTLAVMALLVFLASACGGGDTTDGAVVAKQVRGQVIDVVSRNIAEIELLTIRDDAGQEYRFTTEGFVEFTPSHLKEHQLFGQPVLVKYVEREGRLVAVEIGD